MSAALYILLATLVVWLFFDSQRHRAATRLHARVIEEIVEYIDSDRLNQKVMRHNE